MNPTPIREEKVREGNPQGSLPEAPAPQQSLSLYGIIEELQCLCDSYEMCEAPELQAECWAEIERYVNLEVRKVDGIAGYLGRCEEEAKFLKSEAKRITQRAELWERRQERLEKYIANILQAGGRNEKGRWPKLEGKLHTFSLREGSAHVEITDEAQIPAEFKTLTITVPARVWGVFAQYMQTHTEMAKAVYEDLKDGITKTDCSIAKCEVKKAIQGGAEIPGADLEFSKPSLIVR